MIISSIPLSAAGGATKKSVQNEYKEKYLTHSNPKGQFQLQMSGNGIGVCILNKQIKLSIKRIDVKQNVMKNIFLMIAVFGVSVFCTSCKTIECYCTTSDSVSQSNFQNDLDKAVKDMGIGDDCSDLEVKLRNNYGYRNVSCY